MSYISYIQIQPGFGGDAQNDNPGRAIADAGDSTATPPGHSEQLRISAAMVWEVLQRQLEEIHRSTIPSFRTCSGTKSALRSGIKSHLNDKKGSLELKKIN